MAAAKPGFISGHGAYAEQFPASIGQTVSAASLSVVIASDYILPVSFSNDENYGVVGNSTLRTASQIGNATGAADFNSGAAGAQTLRTVLSTRHENVATPLAAQLSNGGAAIAYDFGASGATVVRVAALLGNAAGVVDYNTGAAGAQTQRAVLATRHEAVATPLAVTMSSGAAAVDYAAGAVSANTPRIVQAGRPLTTTTVLTNDYTGVNVTTAAYVQLVASTANAINLLHIFDSSGSFIIIATGAAASEVDRLYIPPGGSGVPFQLNIPAGTRISLKALDVSATTGRFLLTALA